MMHKNKISYRYITLGIAIFMATLFFMDMGGTPEMAATLAITLLVAFWWITEALPLGVTSLLPLVLFPTFGVLNGKDVSSSYMNYVIFLFIGGAIMGLAIEKWELHKRIALKILSVSGNKPFRLMLGFMICSGFLSMWISNITATMIMIPIAISVSSLSHKNLEERELRKYTACLLLSIAYACSIGGITTVVGTPPNLSFVRISEILYPDTPEVSFLQWLLASLPIAMPMFLSVLILLYFTGVPKSVKENVPDKNHFKKQYESLGKMTLEQKKVLCLFIILIFLWLFRKELIIGSLHIPGWSNFFKNPEYLNDGTIAIFICLLLFLVPSSTKNKGLITWEITQKIPWNIVFLLGGGFAIASAFVKSGLSIHLAKQLAGFEDTSAMGIIAAVAGLIVFLTEFTSNTATTEIMLPVISGVASSAQLNPLLLMLSVTFAASMAFMFPAATGPNALVFGTGKIKMTEMLKIGFILNIIAIIIITVTLLFWVPYLLQQGIRN